MLVLGQAGGVGYSRTSNQKNLAYNALDNIQGRGLYERLALSRDKDEVMCLAAEGQVV